MLSNYFNDQTLKEEQAENKHSNIHVVLALKVQRSRICNITLIYMNCINVRFHKIMMNHHKAINSFEKNKNETKRDKGTCKSH